MPDPPAGTITFLFTDIEGSTRLWEQHPEAMKEALARHDALLRAAIESHGGYVFKTMGDAFCAAFATPIDALCAALQGELALSVASWEEPIPLRVRMALHTGAAYLRQGDYFGAPLSRVARLLAAGHGGQILVSQTTAEVARGALPEGMSLRDLGVHRLRDLSQAESIFQAHHPGLPSDFPSLRSLQAFSHNLPVQLTSFIGREGDLEEGKRLLSVARLLTLTGPGGTGKTRLALQLAADVLEEYSDGVWLVELAALTDPALVPQTVATSLGVREEGGRPLLQSLVEQVSPRRLLVLLDNCEHLLAACATLTQHLLRTCPGLRILATSREYLGIPGEQTYGLPSLAVPDLTRQYTAEDLTQYASARLFLDRAALAQPAFRATSENAPSVARICQRLDGIPLAIELAAARVRVLPVDEIERRLGDRFRLLTGGSRTALPRQQTLRALIDWSYEMLTERECALLRRLSVFAGGWTLEAAEAVGATEGIDPAQVLDLLTALLDKSLVSYEQPDGAPRYRLLETVREYARDRLQESREMEAARAAHRDFFLRLAEQAEPELRGPQQAAWLGRLSVEHDNLRAALEWSLSPGAGGRLGDAEAGVRLAGALWRFWYVRGHQTEGRRWLEQAVANSAGVPDTLRARALNGAGILAWAQGDHPAAGVFQEETLRIRQQAGDQEGIAASLNNLGLVARAQDDHPAARACFEESLAAYRELDDVAGIAAAVNNLAGICLELRDLAAARSLYEEALALQRERGDRWGVCLALNNLGEVATGIGDFPTAPALFQESLRIGCELGDRGRIACSLVSLGKLAAQLGEFERAARLLGAAEAAREEISAPATPAVEAELAETLAALREGLGEAACAAAWAEGRAAPLERAIEWALES